MFKYVKFNKVELSSTTLEFKDLVDGVKVNYFDGNIVSLESEDEESIDNLILLQDENINCVEIDANEFKSGVEKSSRYSRILNKVDIFYNNEMKIITQKYPAVERETWGLQLEQAKAYKSSGDENDAPFLKVLADNDGVSIDEFATAVIEKAKLYEEMSALALAKKRMYKRELLAEIGVF